MRVGEMWRGADGTEYRVVGVNAVAKDQPRWWVDMEPEPGDRMLGPADPARLHTLPASMFGELSFALVLP